MRNSIKCSAFSADSLRTLIREVLGVQAGTSWRSEQVEYLCSYLADEEVKARTVVLETHYVDRHYMEEFSMYYAKCLVPPRNRCARLHFFSAEVSTDQLDVMLGCPDDEDPALCEFRKSYLGFVVLRPVAEAPVGRTMLKPYPASSGPKGHGRSFPAISSAASHLGTLRLTVEGLPFQQQDSRVGACSTAALWSALAGAVRADGGRPPTPAQVTDAAVRYLLPDGRAYPSDGLRLEQICEAVRIHGSSPELLTLVCRCEGPCDCQLTNGAYIRGYLRSRIPIILSLMPLYDHSTKSGTRLVDDGASPGHAVTAVGFSDDAEEERPTYAPFYKHAPTPLHRSACEFEKLYVHDDRFGPYTRAPMWRTYFYSSEDDADAKANASRGLVLVLKDDRPWVVSHAIVPLYPKVRTSLTELLLAGQEWRGIIAKTLQLNAHELQFDFRLVRSGEYLASLRRGGRGALDSVRTARFARDVFLSRYVGLVEFRIGEEPVADLLWDTTDRITTEGRSNRRLLAGGVIYRDAHREDLMALLSPQDEVAVV